MNDTIKDFLLNHSVVNGQMIPVDITLHHYNFYGIIIDYHWPIPFISWLSAGCIIAMIIFLKKWKKKLEREEN